MRSIALETKRTDKYIKTPFIEAVIAEESKVFQDSSIHSLYFRPHLMAIRFTCLAQVSHLILCRPLLL